MIRLLAITTRLVCYRWARRDLQAQGRHGDPDMPRIVRSINLLEHQQRAEIARIRRWRQSSPTLSAVKNWL